MSSVNFTSPPDQISDRQGAESLNGISKRHNLIVRLSEPRFTLQDALFAAQLLDTSDNPHKKRDHSIKCMEAVGQMVNVSLIFCRLDNQSYWIKDHLHSKAKVQNQTLMHMCRLNNNTRTNPTCSTSACVLV